MIKSFFARTSTVARLETGPLGPELSALAAKLESERYSKLTVRRYLTRCDRFGRWLTKSNVPLDQATDEVIERYLRRKKNAGAIRNSLRHLRVLNQIECSAAEDAPTNEVGLLLALYEEYLDQVLGLASATRRIYVFFATRFLDYQSQAGAIDWSKLTADSILEFVRWDAAKRKGTGPAFTATSVRSLLRYLVAQGKITPGLDTVIPTNRRWLHAALPQHFTEDEVRRLLSACLDGTALGKRNYAMLLLLSRLGLRANEVTRLKLDDIDWLNGQVVIRNSKAHRERVLPLARDLGEALLAYLRDGRPTTNHRDLFLEHVAPFRPLKNSSVIAKIIGRLLTKTGIERQSRAGAQLFRHSVATHLINQGASFKEVADVLGHQVLQTTAIYAKLDLAALSRVALPWPGGDQ